VGQVTPVVTLSEVVAAMAPMTLQTKGLSPCRSSQGWKWSEIITDEKPAASACRACSRRTRGPCSSLDRNIPYSAMPRALPVK
jgi:hypothetical protein